MRGVCVLCVLFSRLCASAVLLLPGCREREAPGPAPSEAAGGELAARLKEAVKAPEDERLRLVVQAVHETVAKEVACLGQFASATTASAQQMAARECRSQTLARGGSETAEWIVLHRTGEILAALPPRRNQEATEALGRVDFRLPIPAAFKGLARSYAVPAVPPEAATPARAPIYVLVDMGGAFRGGRWPSATFDGNGFRPAGGPFPGADLDPGAIRASLEGGAMLLVDHGVAAGTILAQVTAIGRVDVGAAVPGQATVRAFALTFADKEPAAAPGALRVTLGERAANVEARAPRAAVAPVWIERSAATFDVAEIARAVREHQKKAPVEGKRPIVLAVEEDARWGQLIAVAAGLGAEPGIEIVVIPSSGRTHQMATGVTVLTPVVKGAVDPELVRQVLRRARPLIDTCYVRELAQRPDVAGRVDLSFTIKPDGRATAVRAKFSDAAVARCVADPVESFEFARPIGGGTAEVRAPITLTPQAPLMR